MLEIRKKKWIKTSSFYKVLLTIRKNQPVPEAKTMRWAIPAVHQRKKKSKNGMEEFNKVNGCGSNLTTENGSLLNDP